MTLVIGSFGIFVMDPRTTPDVCEHIYPISVITNGDIVPRRVKVVPKLSTKS